MVEESEDHEVHPACSRTPTTERMHLAHTTVSQLEQEPTLALVPWGFPWEDGIIVLAWGKLPTSVTLFNRSATKDAALDESWSELGMPLLTQAEGHGPQVPTCRCLDWFKTQTYGASQAC